MAQQPGPAAAIVVGGGVSGLAAALELRARGLAVRVLDAYSPSEAHTRAASSDTGRIVRPDYPEEALARLGLRAVEGWRAWNARCGATPLFHETGVTFIKQCHELEQASVEARSLATLARLAPAAPPRTLADADAVHRALPALAKGLFASGYVSPCAGWVDAALAVATLARWAREAGVEVAEGWRVCDLVRDARTGRVTALHCAVGPAREPRELAVATDTAVLLATGAWTPLLLPELRDRRILTPSAQPSVFFRIDSPRLRAKLAQMPPVCCDISETGLYVFPPARDGSVKVGLHLEPGLAGYALDGPRRLSEEHEAWMAHRAATLIPELRPPAAALVASKVCFYDDAPDAHFIVDRHPASANLFLVAGGSGHSFKFAPVLGALVANVVQQRAPASDDEATLRALWRWRDAGQRVQRDGLRSRVQLTAPKAAL